MIPDLSRDPPRDARIADALRHAAPDADAPPMDWERLNATIEARAALPLARLRQPWWEHAARWGRAAIPLAAAATLVLSLLVARGQQPLPAEVASASGSPMLEQALAGGVSDADRGPADDDGDGLLQDALPADRAP